MPTIVVPIPSGLVARSLLRTGVHAALVQRGVRPVYVVPSQLRERIVADVGDAGEVREVKGAPPKRLEALLNDMAFRVTERRHGIRSVQIRKTANRMRDGVATRRRKDRIAGLLGTSRAMQRFMLRLRDLVASAPEAESVLRSIEPDAVFSPDAFGVYAARYAVAARRAEIPLIALVHSWDNPTTKGSLPSRYDRLLVWSEPTKREMLTIHGAPPDAVEVVGSPQFDVHARPPCESRTDVLARFGLPSDARLVLYATGGPYHCPGEPVFVQHLADRCRSADRAPFGLVVRLHPTDPWDRYAKFHEPGRVFVERTGREDLRSMAEWYPSADEERRYSALLEHADCLVNIGSTASLDAAARGTPVVFVGFDPEAGLPYHRSVRRQFDYDHLRRLMSYRVGRLVTSVDDMMDAVQSTFVSQDDRRATLRNMAASEGFDESGGSAERVAETVARLAHA